MEAAIRTRNLTKFYGRTVGVVGLDLEVPRGIVVGFLGPNGAGKTTTMRLLMDLIRPDEGSAEVLGFDTRRDSREVHRRVGYLPGELALYPRMTAREFLEFFAGLRGRRDLGWAPELADRLKLDLDRRLEHMSTGNKQKVGVIQALMNQPELLILDEPTAGLDPLMQREFFALLRELTAVGTTVFLSSHILDEVEHIADRVAIIREGRLVTTDDVGLLKAAALSTLTITFSSPVPPDAFGGVPGVEDLAIEGARLTCTVVGSVDELLRRATRFEVLTIRSSEADLEDAFMRYFGEVSDVS